MKKKIEWRRGVASVASRKPIRRKWTCWPFVKFTSSVAAGPR